MANFREQSLFLMALPAPYHFVIPRLLTGAVHLVATFSLSLKDSRQGLAKWVLSHFSPRICRIIGELGGAIMTLITHVFVANTRFSGIMRAHKVLLCALNSSCHL